MRAVGTTTAVDDSQLPRYPFLQSIIEASKSKVGRK